MVEIELFESKGTEGMKTVVIGFPESWNEITKAELLAISKHMLTEYTLLAAAKISIFNEILQLRAKEQEKKLQADLLQALNPDDVVLQALPAVDFLYDDNDLTRQHFEKLRLKMLSLPFYGPEDDFNDMTCGEYEDCEIFYNQFMEEPGPEPLANLAAILWRPARKPYNSTRRPYMIYQPRRNTYQVYNSQKMVAAFMKLPMPLLYAIFIWYTGCKTQLPKMFPTVYEGDGTGSNGPDYSAFTKCIHSGAGAKNGSREQIRLTLLKEYFFEMELEAIKAKELKASYEHK